jgi:hypothetical protein
MNDETYEVKFINDGTGEYWDLHQGPRATIKKGININKFLPIFQKRINIKCFVCLA